MYNSNNKYKNNNLKSDELAEPKNFRKNSLSGNILETETLDDDNELINDVDEEFVQDADEIPNDDYNSDQSTNMINSGKDSVFNKSRKVSSKKRINNKKNNLPKLSKNKKLKISKSRKVAKTTRKAKKVGAAFRAAKIALRLFFSKFGILILAGIVIFLILVIGVVCLLALSASAESPSSSTGYYDSSCDYNQTKVYYYSNTASYDNLSIDEFVVGVTYAYIKDKNLSDEATKALMVIVKTNVLSEGNYNNNNKELNLSEFGSGYIPLDEFDSDKLVSLYNEISDGIYVSSSYNGTISNLSSSDALQLDDSILTKLENVSSSLNYEEILKELYGSNDKHLYKICDHCTFYNLTENDSLWWPIGSSNPTNGNVYGGKPVTINITSKFGPRDVGGLASSYHKGIDIGAANNTPVIAIKSGTVRVVSNGCDNNGSLSNDCGGGLGNYVSIDHGNGVIAVYAHLFPNSITVSSGEVVIQGQKIAESGNSGTSNGPHLHFGYQLNGTYVNPLDYIDPNNPRPVTQYGNYVNDTNPKTTAEIKNALCATLLNNGYSENATAGILANVAAEGSFALNNLEGCYEKDQCCYNGTYGYCKHPEIGDFGSDEAYTNGVDSGAYAKNLFVNDHAGYGLIQWTSSGRKKGLYEYAKSLNLSIASFTVQYGYLIEEMKGYKTTYKYVTGNYSAYDIANNFCLDFESPANENTTCPNRANTYANTMLTYVQNNCS